MIVGLLLAFLQATAPAARPEAAPGTRYDERIPTLEQVVGHHPGDEVSTPEEIVRYLEALARAAPDRTRLIEYAASWQGRPLHMLVIAAPERIARLDGIQDDLRRLADPRTLEPGEAERLIGQLPVVTALLHSVHGNEISSSGAAMVTAHHLLAARNDPVVDLILRESIVLIDPLQNPDGRARFVFQMRAGRAASPDSGPMAAERDEPWPGGRSNHYLFDLNRDWFAQTQPESRGRIAQLLAWQPHVVVDLHEMGGESTYYFPPPAVPGNPHTTKAQHAMLEVFGRANAARFDARGFSYFSREIFDSFYPGYGASWPLSQGAIGMTFEMASARGLVYRRRDGSELTYWDGIVQHFTAAISTAETAARHRERMLRDFLEFRQSAVRQGEQGPVREYLLPPGDDPGHAGRLARLLVQNGIEVRRAEEPFRSGDRTLPAGTYIVPLAQPAGRLARNLLDPHTAMDPAFVATQVERRRIRLPDQIYDVTAWSMSLLWGVESIAGDRASTVRSTHVMGPRAGGAAAPLPGARVAYLLPWGASAATAVAEALQAGLRVGIANQAFTLGGRDYPIGTAIVRVSDNGDDVQMRLGEIAARHSAQVFAADSGFVEAGISLGSNQVRAMKAPRVLLAWDAPAQSLSAGWTRYVLEQRYGQPVTAVRVGSLGRVDLHRFDVVVLPAGTYSPQIGGDLLRRLRDWMTAGGTLITLGEASRWAARESVGLLDTRTELRGGAPESDAPPARPGDAARPATGLLDAIQPERERPEQTPGAILRVILDQTHWLSAGTAGEVHALVDGQRVFTPIKLDRGVNVGHYADQDRLLSSGILWDPAREQLPHKAFLLHQPVGRGRLIAFAEEPNYRAYAEATQLLFMNAVLIGPAQ